MTKDFWRGMRFVPLLITQFFGALNDNLFKTTLLTFVAFKMGADEQVSGIYSNIIAGVFILPYFLFSALAGLIADKYNRAYLVRILKVTELMLMVGAGAVFITKSVPLLIVILFFMGTQSTFFGPIKYALLPQLLRQEELIAGNAYIEGSTYSSIILGRILGTILSVNASIGLLVTCSIIGMVAAYKIPNAAGADENLIINFNLFKQIRDNYRLIRSRIIIFRAILGASWFWMLGAFVLTNVFPLCSKVLNTEPEVVTLCLILFSVGVGAGSLLCNKLLKGKVSVLYVPLSAFCLSICAFVIYFLSLDFPVYESALTLGEFITLPRGTALLTFFFLFACAGGVYVVPLNALMQKRAPKNSVASVIAGNNIINSLGMVLVALGSVALLALGLEIVDLFLIMAILSLLMA